MGRSTKARGINFAQDGTYTVDARYRGERIYQRGFANYAEAEDFLIFRKERRRKLLDFGERPKITLDAAAAHYITMMSEKGKVSLETDIYMLKPVIEHCGAVTLDLVSNQTLAPFIEARRAIGIKTKSINNALGVVRRICNLAATDWRHENGVTWLDKAPLISMLKLDDQRPPRPMAWDEQRKLLPALPAHLANMVLFDLNTGVRKEVVCQLRWDWEIRLLIRSNISVSVFVVPRRYVKGRKSERIIVCNSVAQSIIDAQRGKHKERVFTYFRPTKRKAPVYVPVDSMNNTAWQRARTEAGLGGMHIHDLRHTVGMRLREAGVPERTQDDILWHSKGTMTGHYAIAQIAELYDALEKIKEPTTVESVNVLELMRQKVTQNSRRERKTA